MNTQLNEQLEERVHLIERASDYGDLDSTLTSIYSEDIRFELGNFMFEGRQALRGAAEWDRAVNTRLAFSDFRMTGDTVTCKCTAEDDFLKLQGIEHEYYDPVTFVFANNRIKYANFQRTAESRRANNAAFRPFNEWATKERARQLADLMPSGKFVLSAESARGWLTVATEWREATASQ